MIENFTTLILGAGTSMPYGFPSGERLVETILNIQPQSIFPQDTNFHERSSSLNKLQQRLRKSGVGSIDYFISQNRSFSDLSKQLITFSITQCETTDLAVADKDDLWYKYLWTTLYEGADSWNDLFYNRVSIITFNYDTSLEHFLYQSFLNLFEGTTHDNAVQFIKHLNIVHVFGTTGGDRTKDDFRSFGTPFSSSNYEELVIASKQIETIGESKKLAINNTPRLTAKIRQADRIVILGFGYHQENIELLGLKFGISEKPTESLYFSAYGQPISKMRSILRGLQTQSFGNRNWPSSSFIVESDVGRLKTLEFLRQSGALQN